MTEEGNPGNWRGVARVVARLHTPLLDEGVRLVDTPGVGSVHEHNTLATDAYLPSLDAAVLVVSADPPISKAERAFLERVVEHAVRLFVVLNKADYLAPGELERIVAFTERVVQEVAPDWPGPVYTLSARTDVGDPAALRRFRHDLERFLRGDRAAAVVAYRRAAEPITDRAVSRVEQLQAEAAGAFGVPLPAFIAPELDLEVPQSVRGGGHAVAGHGVCDGGLMIDLSLMSRSDRHRPGVPGPSGGADGTGRADLLAAGQRAAGAAAPARLRARGARRAGDHPGDDARAAAAVPAA